MGDLALVKLHEDGEHLVLTATDGGRFMLPITEELRAAVRRDRAHLEHLRAESSSLPPREIQARLRAGQTVDAVSMAAGITPEQVERYAGPVLAEQEFVIDQVRRGRHGKVTLDKLVAQRLEARVSDPDSVVWSATREGGAPWLVTALFEVNSAPRTAQWTYTVAGRALTAIDDEARWLQADDPVPTEQDPFFDQRGASHIPPAPEGTTTDNLLEELSSRRGLRTPTRPRPAAAGDDLAYQDFDPPLVMDISDGAPDGRDRAQGPHSGEPGGDVVAFAPRGERQRPAPVPPLQDGIEEVEAPSDSSPDDNTEPVEPAQAERKPSRKGRAKVPSLDEIVFGAKPRQ